MTTLKPTEIWNGWVPQPVYEDARYFIAKLTAERESLLKEIAHLKWIIDQCIAIATIGTSR